MVIVSDMREEERLLSEGLGTAGELALVIVVVPRNDQFFGGQLDCNMQTENVQCILYTVQVCNGPNIIVEPLVQVGHQRLSSALDFPFELSLNPNPVAGKSGHYRNEDTSLYRTSPQCDRKRGPTVGHS